jgi:thiol-disulfide isomerase/thioredoxin
MIRKVYTSGLMFIILATFSHAAPTQEAPNFAVYNTNGARVVFYDILAKVPQGGLLVVNFTSIYCKPCKKEIPELSSIIGKASGTSNLICIYSETGDPVKKSAKELGVADRAYVDPFGNIRKLFDVTKIPVTIIVGKNYHILARFEGYSSENMSQIEKIILHK